MIKDFLFPKTALLIALVCLFYINRSILLFFLPGVLIFYHPISKKLSLFENLIFAVFLSLSALVAGYWFLKYIPISLTNLVYTLWVISIVFIMVHKKTSKITNIEIKKSDLLLIALTITLSAIFGKTYYSTIVPPGADMTTYAYYSKVIEYNNGFPTSLEPFVPIQKFGAESFGLSLISAVISLLSGVESYKTIHFVSVSTYILAATAIVVFLLTHFSILTSIMSTFVLLFLNREILRYMEWGGSSTILAIAFCAVGIAYIFNLLKHRFLGVREMIIASIVFWASFTIHHIPLFILLYWIGAIIIYLFLTKNFQVLRHIILIPLILFLLSIPFLTSITYPNQDIINFSRSWQTNPKFDFVWHGNLSNSLYTIPNYVEKRYGELIFFLTCLGIFSAYKNSIKYRRVFGSGLIIFFLLVLNSKYWILPFSFILYPDRIATTALLPISFFIGAFIQNLTGIFKKLNYPGQKLTLTIVFVAVCAYYLKTTALLNYKTLNNEVALLTSVTTDDLNAFTWIKLNTTQNSIFLNNYGDAGIWIPAIAERKIKTYDSSLENWSDLQKYESIVKPNYVYIGSKVVYPKSINHTNNEYSENPGYLPVFSSGNTYIYKILSP